AEGNPVFNPTQWQPYKVAIRLGWGWYHSEYSGRPVPPSPSELQARQKFRKNEEQKREEEETRFKKHPHFYVNYKDKMPKTEGELMALFRKVPRLINSWGLCSIVNVRKTKTMGIVLDLRYERPEMGDIILCKQYSAESHLAEGDILYDKDRDLWITTEIVRKHKRTRR